VWWSGWQLAADATQRRGPSVGVEPALVQTPQVPMTRPTRPGHQTVLPPDDTEGTRTLARPKAMAMQVFENEWLDS